VVACSGGVAFAGGVRFTRGIAVAFMRGIAFAFTRGIAFVFTRLFARAFAVAHAGAPLAGRSVEAAHLGADQRRFFLAAVGDVVRAAARWAAAEREFERLLLDAEPALADEAFLAPDGAAFAAIGVIFAAAAGQLAGGAHGEAVQAAFRLPVAVARGAIGRVRVLAVRAARLLPPRPGVGRVAPRGRIARRLRRAEQFPRLGQMLAEGVLHDVEPQQALLAAGPRRVGLRRQRLDPLPLGVGRGVLEALVEPDEVPGKPVQRRHQPPLSGRCHDPVRSISPRERSFQGAVRETFLKPPPRHPARSHCCARHDVRGHCRRWLWPISGHGTTATHAR
jgi:hypothetical protein